MDHNGEELVLGFGGFGRVLLGARNEHQVWTHDNCGNLLCSV